MADKSWKAFERRLARRVGGRRIPVTGERAGADVIVDNDQPLLFAPGELLACGLRDAHTQPLVGRRTGDGVRSWRTSPALAWQWPLVEWTRTGNSYAALGFDCDSRDAVERAAASCMGAGDLPTPNVYATRTATGHAQIFYLLDRPVHRGRPRAGQAASLTRAGRPSTTGPRSARIPATRAY